MKFIMIRDHDDNEVAINASNITAIKSLAGHVCLLIGGDTPILTQFTSVTAAVDYVQRASSVSLYDSNIQIGANQ